MLPSVTLPSSLAAKNMKMATGYIDRLEFLQYHTNDMPGYWSTTCNKDNFRSLALLLLLLQWRLLPLLQWMPLIDFVQVLMLVLEPWSIPRPNNWFLVGVSILWMKEDTIAYPHRTWFHYRKPDYALDYPSWANRRHKYHNTWADSMSVNITSCIKSLTCSFSFSHHGLPQYKRWYYAWRYAQCNISGIDALTCRLSSLNLT